jgi:hypothetical protein
MAPMKKSERNLTIITVTIVVLALLYNFVLADLFTGGDGGAETSATVDLADEQTRFERYASTLRDGPAIRQRYQAIASLESGEGDARTPAESFGNELYTLLTRRLNIASPRIEPPNYSVIEDVDDYYFVEIEVGVGGTYDQLVQLLLDMEQLGLLIKTFRFEMAGRGANGEVSLNVTVARLVKHDDYSRRRLQHYLR